ncbi:gluconolactonase [Terriglobus roseus DSM 18391]|uniref:Gluconolactonase n=2 Tax=Terriglobus roseus TaxID=392734 RepID=I3ZFP6_TERRK|nr:gluconolactonase [Terriglobus roseus DSM 18391]
MSVALAGCKAKQPAPAVVASPPAQAASASLEVVRLDAALDAVIAPGTKIEKVASGFVFAEGPMWHEGQLWFSDVAGNKMYAMTADGHTPVLIDHAGGLDSYPAGMPKGSNGMATDKDGSVLMTQHGVRRIARLDDHQKPTTFLDRFEGKRFNSPNDLVFAPDGSLWFTDPPYGLTGQDRDPAKELPFNGVYRYANGKLTAPIRELARPNGIGFTSDGKTLYVSNSGPEMYVERYDVNADGTVSKGTRFIEYPGSAPDVPDGLKLDSANNLWTSGPGGIRIISPAGKVLGQIKLPEVAANMAWADGGKTLYITASTSIYRLPVKTPGALPHYVK